MGVNTLITKIGLPSDTGGLIKSSSGTVDNVFIFQDSEGQKWERQRDGVYRASWVCGLTSSGDQTSALQSVFSHSSVKEVIFDSGDITISGTLTVAATKKITFKNGARLIGSGTLSGGIINAGMDASIFALTLTVNPSGVANSSGRFSAKWFGAKGDNVQDDTTYLQKAIDTVIANQDKVKNIYVPVGVYKTTEPLILYKWDGTRYQQVCVNLIGETESTGLGQNTTINFYNDDLFCIGIQQGKRCKIRGLLLQGEFAYPYTTAYDFYSKSLAAYTDGSRRDSPQSPHCGIAIDPFNNSTGVYPTDGGYPGYSSWYRGPGLGLTQAGSTNIQIKECGISGFVVCIASSLNGLTKNAEMTQVFDCQFRDCKVGIAMSQDQEKGNVCKGIMAWINIHTLFASGLYGHQIPGNWYIENVNIAGNVQQMFYNNGQGYYATYATNIFAEGLGKIGYIGTVLQSCISDSTFDLALPDSSYFYDYAIEGDFTLYKSCIFRYYGSAYNVPVGVRGKAYFQNCHFANVPYCYDPDISSATADVVSQSGMSVFRDCIINDYILGTSESISAQPSDMDKWIVYGKRTFKHVVNDLVRNEYVDHVIDGGHKVNDVLWATTFNDANLVTITIASDRTSTITVGSAYVNRFKAGCLVVEVSGKVVGYCQSVNSGANQITVYFVSPSITSGNTYQIGCVYPRFNVGSFIGDTSAGTNTITNVVFDEIGPDGSDIVGSIIELPVFVNYALTGKYQRLAKVTAYNSGTRTITVDQNIPATMEGVYLGLGRHEKNVYGINDIDSIDADTILISGSKALVNVYPGGDQKSYHIHKTGFADASGVGGGETRQAEWMELNLVKQVLASYTADNESSAYTGATDGEAKLVDLNALRVAYENLRASHEDLRTKLISSRIVS